MREGVTTSVTPLAQLSARSMSGSMGEGEVGVGRVVSLGDTV